MKWYSQNLTSSSPSQTASSRGPLTAGYLFGAGVMIAGGLIAWFFGVNAERQSLEDIATPLSTVSKPRTDISPAAT